MRQAHPKFIAADAKLVAISGKSATVARSLAPTMPFPLLLDPDHTARQVLDVGRLSLAQTMGVTSAKNYAKARNQANNLRVFPDEATQTPAVFIFDAEQNVTWKHLGKALGDYPTIDTVVSNI